MLDVVKVAAADIGVITPYKAMAQQLQTALVRLPDCRAVKVDTVDAFQGQEKRVNSVQLDRGWVALLQLCHRVTFLAATHMQLQLCTKLSLCLLSTGCLHLSCTSRHLSILQ